MGAGIAIVFSIGCGAITVCNIKIAFDPNCFRIKFYM